MNWQGFLAATALGVSAHLLVFIRGEWHLRAPGVVVCHVAALATGISLHTHKSPEAASSIAVWWLQCFPYYLFGMFTSITIYRLFFHRIRHFPGPRAAAFSKLWSVYQCRDSRNHLFLDGLHKKYGNFVRTG
jgi:tryprostatin B 6-hydroxylase